MSVKTLLLTGISAALLPVAADVAITVSIYTGQNAAAANATIAQPVTLTPDATVSVGAINFTDAPGNDSTNFTVGAFLNNPVGLSAAVAGATLNNTTSCSPDRPILLPARTAPSSRTMMVSSSTSPALAGSSTSPGRRHRC